MEELFKYIAQETEKKGYVLRDEIQPFGEKEREAILEWIDMVLAVLADESEMTPGETLLFVADLFVMAVGIAHVAGITEEQLNLAIKVIIKNGKKS